ncbi:hypothetical protein ACWEJ6_52935 [Nonomuraea sp. NPDC004702]
MADAVAYVCAHLEELRDEHPRLLRRVLAALKHGRDPVGPLRALHEAMLAAGDHLGLYGTRSLWPVGIDVSRSGEEVYLCPGRHGCSHYRWPDPVGDTPRCAISGDPMRLDRL